MKNLSTIPRLSLSETFTILITLVVCLAGFTEAEVRSNYRKQDSNQQEENYLLKEASFKENVPYFHQIENESEENNVAKFKIIPESPLERLIKRHSDEFGQSDESDERESDGYGYDDDEYYHFNFKRNDDSLENKAEKEGVHDINLKEGMKFMNVNPKEKTKDSETIEMLNFKESHPPINYEGNPNLMEKSKQHPEEIAHKKQSNAGAGIIASLKMSDIRENSAIDEKMKDRKEESGLTSASADSKIAETKKSVKGTEEKEGAKLKDSKLEDSEKKEKEASLQDAKEAVIAKGLKDNSKSTEEKEKGVKLSDSAKLEENLDKITSKSKENDPSKITKEETEVPRYAEKVNSEVINPKGLSQINNRASFVSSDYKDNLDAMKNAVIEEDDKNSEEIGAFQGDLRRGRDKLRKLYNERITEPRYSFFNPRDSNSEMFREAIKGKDYVPSFFDQGGSDYFKKRESWKDWKDGGQSLKYRTSSSTDHQDQAQQQFVQQQQLQLQQQQQQISSDSQQSGSHPLDLSLDSRYKTIYGFSFPSNELENTEYHKNYIKSLKRYKGMTDEQKVIVPDSSAGNSDKNSYSEPNKKKLQDTVKRRSMMTEDTPEGKENALSKHQKLRRNIYKSDSQSRSVSDNQFQRCAVNPKTTSSVTKTANEDTKLSDMKKSEEEEDSNRARRKSPLKLEYEIKVINQSPQDSKTAELSHSTSRRFEKDLKTKLATEDKYLKKYPYSQVSREDLMSLGEWESEKKIKRKAPIWKRHDQKSVIQTRAVPSGYYGNRVKFGQKNCVRNNEKTNSEPTFIDSSHVSSSYLGGDDVPSMADKNKLQRSWEVRQQDYKHDPMKRYDDSGSKGNSLFLVKKGERKVLPFQEGSPQSVAEGNISQDNIAKILSKENDYVILKKKDNKKFDASGYTLLNSFSPEDQQDSFKSNVKQMLTKNRGLHTRSFHPEKEEKKLTSSFHSSKSNLKKTFEKFRDLAGFFKDNEQETVDNQYSGPELKEGRDIVFSEDKLPDPIVISNDASGKNQAYSQKPQNSIFSISTNFKTLDQQQDKKTDLPSSNEVEKNMFTAEVKPDASESAWEPALKNAFPEAKSINSLSKNGNEIIILDLNRNRLKPGYGMPKQPSQYGMLGLSSQVPPLPASSDKKVQFLLSASPSKMPSAGAKLPQKGSAFPSKLDAPVSRAYTLLRNGEGVSQISFQDLRDIPTLLKALTESKPNPSAKLITKRSPSYEESPVSNNYNKFLRELNELSELNKVGYRKGKLTKKRNANVIALPSSSFPELSTYSHTNIKHLGNLLQTIMSGDNPEFKSVGEGANDDIPKYREDIEKFSCEPNQDLQYQGQVSKASFPLAENKEENSLFREERGTKNDKNYQELFEKLEATSDKIDRRRREEALKRKLKRTADDSVAIKHEFDKTEASSLEEDKCSKMSPDSSGKDKTSFGEAQDDFKSELKSSDDTKESSEGDKSYLKSDYENHLNEFFENLNTNKNQKHQLISPSENTWRRKKRKDYQRRKRSASVDVKNKVSTTAVQNTILKNLAEDNYQSVYSPGIKRRLFSTSNEADDADNFSDAYERDKNVIAEESQAKCVKNSLNKCIDPLIVELFGAVDKDEEKNRARRSLTSGFHSDFKREIDLDESMPNDFQNFLVTSLGGFGSQKREVIKKDVALWEGKESSQDNSNQIVENSPGGKDTHEDSTLEKREVSPNESRKTQTYFQSGSNPDPSMADVMSTMNHAEKKIRSDDKSKLKTKIGFAEEKLPTQIRIQITNASSKEKKSSKPIMDESETTSTEMENLPKEKEFFDKNKINALRMHNIPKLHSLSKSKFSFSDYEEPDGTENSNGSQNPYRPYRRRRKKKKYVMENPAKPIKDFIKFDQKTMETFLKRIMTDQSASIEQTTQKSPVSNHLPQVETVYNPTQGTNKAQLENTRFGKLSTISNKNSASVKNNLQSSDPMAYDEAIIRNYLKDKTDKIKPDKVKEYEDLDWKPGSGKMRLRQELGWEPPNALNMPKSPIADFSTYSINADPPSYISPFSQRMKPQPPSSNYFFHPSSTNADTSNNLYDALKMKQDMKSPNTMSNDRGSSKLLKKPFPYSDMYNKNEEKDKSSNPVFPGVNNGDGGWSYDFSMPKKPSGQGFKNRDFFTPGMKVQNHLDSKSKLSHGSSRKFMKNLDEDKSSVLDPPQPSPMQDNSKDSDYMDGVDDEYLDDDTAKDMQSEEALMSTPMKKPNQLYETPLYHRMYNYKNSDLDDNSEDEEENDEDYEESSEDDDLDDYSLLANTKGIDPELTRSGHDKLTSPSAFQTNSALSPFNCLYPKDNLLELKGHSFEQSEFTNPKNDVKFNQRRQQIPLAGMKIGSLSGTSGLLKKANENANIFEKNLMKGAYGYNFDDNLGQERLPENKVKGLNALLQHDRLMKRKLDLQGKLKRSRAYPQIGSRLFYAAKTEIRDETSSPTLSTRGKQKSRSSRHTYYRRNVLNAEFADPDNGFDNESEENGKHLNENLINFGKSSQEDRNIEDEDTSDLDDVSENLEDDGETISEDNVLENVIGKYIMRKRVASPTDLNKVSEISLKNESNQSEENHKLHKRSLGKCGYSEKAPELKIVKRLSSGHLTENNFRKYHKKNLSIKREIKEFDFDACGIPAVGKNNLRKSKKRENPTQTKRSALDLFKKITNKDRDNKKAENVDGRTAGFEPLSSLNDKKYESSIRDAKFDFLNQVKKLSNEGQQGTIKNNVVEFKSQFPNDVQVSIDQRKREKGKMTAKEIPVKAGQGPWRIELNDQYDINVNGYPNAFGNFKEVEMIPSRQRNENLHGFLVFSNNLRTPKRSTAEDLPATSGSSQKEVGNSYRPKSGRGIYKMHVRKRSLDSSLVATKINNEDAAKSSRGHFTSEEITESHIDIAEKNRALHDSQSLSEGDSIPQLPRVLQRNTKKSRSFVNADEQCENGRFPSIGRLTNRMSVFPPSNDANIFRDSRQVNEETSKYLGQQIVDSILSHVSANPKLKELIAPGLSSRTTVYKEGIDKKKPQADVSEQLQYFLQKFMLDLEKLAEKHVKKRMCSQIDQQSKEFLESLLSVSSNTNRDNSDFEGNENCPNAGTYLNEETSNTDPDRDSDPDPDPDRDPDTDTAEDTPPTPITTTSTLDRSRNSSEEIATLTKKHCLLIKLIEDYEKLSRLEKESLGVNYQALLEELEKTNKDLDKMNFVSSASRNPQIKTCSKNTSNSKNEEAFENALVVKVNQTGDGQNGSCSSQNNSQAKWEDVESSCGSRPPKPPCEEKHNLPIIFFDEEENKQITYRPPPIFEKVEPFNLTLSPTKKQLADAAIKVGHYETDTKAGNSKMDAMEKSKTPTSSQNKFETIFLPSPIPQTFDLLPCQNSTQTANNYHADQPPQSLERVRIKESLSGADTFENSESQILNSENPNSVTELHKLSLGDAAGLQLSLKYRGPWVSNLDVAKSIRNIPGVPESAKILRTDLAASQPKQTKGRVRDAPSLADVKNPKSFITSADGPNNFEDSSKKKPTLGYTVFPYLNFGMFLPKKRPFESVSKEVGPIISEKIPLSYFIKKVSSNGRKRVFLRSNELPQPRRKRDKAQKNNYFFKIGRRKNKLTPHLLDPPEKKREKKRNKPEGERNSENDDEKDAELEYLVWSTMPAVRRQLNNLEAGFEFDELFVKNPKRKKMWKGGEGKLV